jgi:hypothetical protein
MRAMSLIMASMSVVDPWDPGSPRNRDRTRESQRQVRRFLLNWDPIGVAQTDSEDEYDYMISPLVHALHEGADESALVETLGDYRDHMGLRRDDGLGANRRLAADLVAWWAQRVQSN